MLDALGGSVAHGVTSLAPTGLYSISKEKYHSRKDALKLSKYLPAGPLPLQAERPGAFRYEDISIKS